VGISGELAVMIPAILVAAGVMLYFATTVSEFIEEHPTMKILALAFLILIGTLLVIEGWNSELAEEYHLKNYAYFAMAFSVGVEFINIRVRKAEKPVQLKNRPHLPAKQGERAADVTEASDGTSTS
jgi:predicted tellurium resistance membrane protein TerC